jgi:predicted RNA-binding protein
MEERKFTLRISEEESKMLSELKILTNKNSDSAVIRHLITTYKDLTDQYKEERTANRNLEIQLEQMSHKVKAFLKALDALNKLKTSD